MRQMISERSHLVATNLEGEEQRHHARIVGERKQVALGANVLHLILLDHLALLHDLHRKHLLRVLLAHHADLLVCRGNGWRQKFTLEKKFQKNECYKRKSDRKQLA